MEMSLGQRVKAWRLHFGRTVAECAERMGVHKSGLSRIENGHQRVTGDQLEALAVHLGITMVEFYGEIPAPARVDAPGDPPPGKVAASG